LGSLRLRDARVPATPQSTAALRHHLCPPYPHPPPPSRTRFRERRRERACERAVRVKGPVAVRQRDPRVLRRALPGVGLGCGAGWGGIVVRGGLRGRNKLGGHGVTHVGSCWEIQTEARLHSISGCRAAAAPRNPRVLLPLRPQRRPHPPLLPTPPRAPAASAARAACGSRRRPQPRRVRPPGRRAAARGRPAARTRPCPPHACAGGRRGGGRRGVAPASRRGRRGRGGARRPPRWRAAHNRAAPLPAAAAAGATPLRRVPLARLSAPVEARHGAPPAARRSRRQITRCSPKTLHFGRIWTLANSCGFLRPRPNPYTLPRPSRDPPLTAPPPLACQPHALLALACPRREMLPAGASRPAAATAGAPPRGPAPAAAAAAAAAAHRPARTARGMMWAARCVPPAAGRPCRPVGGSPSPLWGDPEPH
jgi:hypothetical protein